MSHRAKSVLAALLWVTAWAGAGVAAQEVEGHWQGRIEVPGRPLEIDVDFGRAEDGSLRGDISIPIQGVQDMELVDVSLEDAAIGFRMPDVPGDPTFAGVVEGEVIAGTFTQGGAELEFRLSRGAAPAEAARQALAGFAEFAAQARADWNVPGLAVAVVRGGEVVFAEGFGQRSVEDDLPMTADTLCPVGSTTKAFTTTMLGLLVDDGALAWDEPLREYLPRFRLQDPLTTELITPRDLVTHRSGLPRHDLVWYNRHHGTRADLVAALAHLQPSAGLREKFQYNNLMFLTAGYLVERLTGESWEEAVRARLLSPLGMERTNFSVDNSQLDEDFSWPYRETDDDEIERIPFRQIDLVGPAGSLNSSVNEMSRWLLFNLSGGRVGAERLLGAAILADIHSPHMPTGATPDRKEISQASYGLGWIIDTYRGHRRVAHAGGIDGFTASVVLFPDDDLGMVAIGNRASPLPDILNRHAADLMLGLEPIDWNGEALEERAAAKKLQDEAEAKKETTRVAGTEPSHPLGDYAGDYEHPGYGALRVELDGERLRLVFNEIEVPLEHWHYDVWSGAETEGDKTFEDQKFQFRTDVDGRIATVESMMDPVVDPVVFAKRPDARLSDPQHLRRLVGTYAVPGQKVIVELAGSSLTVVLPGQPLYTLEPALGGRFVLAELPVVQVGFDLGDEGPASAVTFYQPNGVYTAPRVIE